MCDHSKPCEHSICLTCRLELWHEGRFDELLIEGRAIHQKLYCQRHKPPECSRLIRSFTNLMLQGRTRAAIRLLTDNDNGRIRQLSDPAFPDSTDSPTVLDVLIDKHRPPQPYTVNSLVSPGLDPPIVHPIIYEAIDARCIRSTALRTFGAGGPFGTDAYC